MSTCRRGSGQHCAPTPALCQPSTNQSSVFHLSPPQSSLASHTRHPPSARPGAHRHVHGQRACSSHFPGPSRCWGEESGSSSSGGQPTLEGAWLTPLPPAVPTLTFSGQWLQAWAWSMWAKSPPWQESAGARAGHFPAKLCAVEATEATWAEPACCPPETQAELARLAS